MTAFAINGGALNSSGWNGPGILQNPTPDHVILFNQTTIILNWSAIGGAVSYDLEVSLFSDFRTSFLSINIPTISTHTFTDGQVDDAKRYWRIRPKDALGDFTERFSEVGHYWLDTSAPAQIELDRNNFAMADISITTDVCVLDLFPVYRIMPKNIFRITARNRLGELLTEFLTSKDIITLNFTDEQIIEHPQMDEFQRFNTNKRTFYLLAFKDGVKRRPFPYIWKVQFTDDPTLTMISAGRPDVLEGTLNLEEV